MTPQNWSSFPKEVECLFTEEVICSSIAAVSRQITRELSTKKPLVLCVMKGGVVFAGKLLPQLTFPLEFDYIDSSRYPSGTAQPDLELTQTHFPPPDKVTGRSVLVLDDILDEGATLHAIKNRLLLLGAYRVYCAVMVTKNRMRDLPEADLSALLVPDRFVFGMGMDYKGLWRNLPQIYAFKK